MTSEKWKPTPRWLFSLRETTLQTFRLIAPAMHTDWEILPWDPPVVLIKPHQNFETPVLVACRVLLDQAERRVAERVLKERRLPRVHAVWNGYPLCGFTNSPTRYWPENHRFLLPEDFVASMLDPEVHACRGCKTPAIILAKKLAKCRENQQR